MAPTLDGAAGAALEDDRRSTPGRSWRSTGARTGARTYIAFSGGIDTPPVLGSRSTFHMAGVGGVNGYALKAGQRMPLGAGRRHGAILEVVDADAGPIIDGDARHGPSKCVAGPNDDWLDAGHRSSASCRATGPCRRRAAAPACG